MKKDYQIKLFDGNSNSSADQPYRYKNVKKVNHHISVEFNHDAPDDEQTIGENSFSNYDESSFASEHSDDYLDSQALEHDKLENEFEEEEEEENSGGIRAFVRTVNKTEIGLFMLGFTLLLCILFPCIFLKILLIIECIIACLLKLYYDYCEKTKEEPDVFNKLSDGYELILPKEDGKKFSDLVIQEPVEELKELVDYLYHPEEFEAIGFKPENKVLIVGENGYGKNALIEAFANETGLPRIRIHASKLLDSEEQNVFYGIFRMADKWPCYIIQIDSFENLLGHNAPTLSNPATVFDKLKTHLDVFKNILLFATCEDVTALSTDESYENFFKKVIVLEAPNQEQRIQLLKVFTKNLTLSPDIDFALISKNCFGDSIGELKNLVAKAISIAHKNDRKEIIQEDFFNAFDAITFGSSMNKQSEGMRKLVAYHEAGHAIMEYLLKGKEAIIRVVSTGRGVAGGVTYTNSFTEDKKILTKDDLMNEICTLYGGRCAEMIIFNHISTGASSDIRQASSIISNMIERYGMSDEIGPLNVSTKIAMLSVINESAEMRNLISNERLKISRECEKITLSLLTQHRSMLDTLANYLMEHESITGDEMEKLLKNC